jgi:hypothetical protein
VSVRSRLEKWRRLSWADRRLLVEAGGWLAVARAAVLVVPFRHLAPHLGESMAETPTRALATRERANRVGWAVRAASRATPWKTPCLAEAIAGQRMLRRRHIPSTIYLGLSKDGEILTAHAWLRCGARVLTGKSERGQFTAVASFAHTG